MSVTAIKTKAEWAFAEQFASSSGALPGIGWVPAARRAAFARFVASGLPHRKLEAWKYTDLRAMIAEPPAPIAAPSRPKLDAAAVAALLGPELAGLACHRYVFLDGRFVEGPASAPKGHHFEPLAAALGRPGVAWLEDTITREPPPSAAVNSIRDLNTAFVSDGATLRIGPDADDLPIHLVFATLGGADQSVATRSLVRIDKGVRAVLIESHVGGNDCADQTNAVTQIHIDAGASVEHIKLLAPGSRATHLGSCDAQLGAGATYRAFHLSQSPRLARNDITVTFEGEGASFAFSAAILGRGKSHVDTTMVIDHAVPRCTSRELVKAVLDDQAHGVFQGKVIVRPDAQKSDGKQSARALLLSPEAEFDSKPELEIYADDVVCGHGSTAAEIDEDQVFYLMARGIPRAQSQALLIEAFAAEALEAIAHEATREAMRARLQAWLAEARS